MILACYMRVFILKSFGQLDDLKGLFCGPELDKEEHEKKLKFKKDKEQYWVNHYLHLQWSGFNKI